MFRTLPLSIIRIFSLYTQKWYMSYSLRAGSGRNWFRPAWHIPLFCLQWKTHDDRQRKFPKHVEFYSKNKFEILVHLDCFIIRIYHDARPKYIEFYTKNKFVKSVHLVDFIIGIYRDAWPKHLEFYSENKFEKLVHLVGFIIRICHDARPKLVEFYSKNKFEKLMHLVSFIIRIYHDARSPERQIRDFNC